MKVSISLSREAIAIVKRLPRGERSRWIDRVVLQASLDAERTVAEMREAGFADDDLRAMVEGRRAGGELTGNILVLSLLSTEQGRGESEE